MNHTTVRARRQNGQLRKATRRRLLLSLIPVVGLALMSLIPTLQLQVEDGRCIQVDGKTAVVCDGEVKFSTN